MMSHSQGIYGWTTLSRGEGKSWSLLTFPGAPSHKQDNTHHFTKHKGENRLSKSKTRGQDICEMSKGWSHIPVLTYGALGLHRTWCCSSHIAETSFTSTSIKTYHFQTPEWVVKIYSDYISRISFLGSTILMSQFLLSPFSMKQVYVQGWNKNQDFGISRKWFVKLEFVPLPVSPCTWNKCIRKRYLMYVSESH